MHPIQSPPNLDVNWHNWPTSHPKPQSPLLSPALQVEGTIDIQQNQIDSIATDVGSISASTSTRQGYSETGLRTVLFWDLMNRETPAKIEYTYNTYAKPNMQTTSNTCFFTDKTPEGYVLGALNSSTSHLEKMNYHGEDFSADQLKGVTIGCPDKKSSQLTFWDLVTMQEVVHAQLDWQGRNLCAMVPSHSNLAVTLQSATWQTSNLISLWDSRIATRAIKENCLSLKKKMNSLAILETSKGPRIVTRSVGHNTIDFRSIFDFISHFGELVESSEVPSGGGPYGGYDLNFMPSKEAGKLCTATKDRWYEGKPGVSNIVKQVTFRSYNLTNDCDSAVSPDLTISFPASTREDPADTFAMDQEKVVFKSPGTQKLIIYKV